MPGRQTSNRETRIGMPPRDHAPARTTITARVSRGPEHAEPHSGDVEVSAELESDLTGQMIGSYRVAELIGTGGMGSVYRARHPAIGTEVAVKVLLPEMAKSKEAVERFLREARASSAIGNQHVPRYYDFGHLRDGRAYAVMEYLEGESLAQRLDRVGPLSVAEAAVLITQAAKALAAAHALGIVHRDIKPDNLFVVREASGRESIKVLDFGIAKVRASDVAKNLTRVGVFIGTPAYAAPEQVFGEAVGPEADIYALGATAFEMLTGVAPFDGDDLSEVFSAKAAKPPAAREIDPELPEGIERTLSRAMALHASDRFATMEELAESVALWSAVERPAVAPTPIRWPLVALVLTLGVVSSVAAVLLAFWVAGDPPPRVVPSRRTAAAHAPHGPLATTVPAIDAPETAAVAPSPDAMATTAPSAPSPELRRRRSPRARENRAQAGTTPTAPRVPTPLPHATPLRPIIADPFSE